MKKLNTNAESIIALIQEWCRLCWPVVAISSKQDRIHSLFILSTESKQAAMVWSLVHLVVEKPIRCAKWIHARKAQSAGFQLPSLCLP
jgi:hypothetical protein